MLLIFMVFLLIAIGYFLFNFRAVLSLLASAVFCAALIWLPNQLAEGNSLLRIGIMLLIILIVFQTVGREIFRTKLLNLLMGLAAIIGIAFNLFNLGRRG